MTDTITHRSIQTRMTALNLNPISFTAQTTADGADWLPRDVLGVDGKSAIIHRGPDALYSFPGWEPYCDGSFGGRYQSFEGALAWMEWIRQEKQGRAA